MTSLALFLLGVASSDATSFRDPAAGIEIPLAGGFGFLARQGSLVVLGSNQTPGAVFLEMGHTFTAAELEAASREGYRDEGVQLAPDGAILRLRDGLAFPVRGTLDGAAVQGMLAGLRRASDGRCFILLAATVPEQWPKLAAAARAMAEGASVFTPVQPPADAGLNRYFAGTRLRFYFSRTSPNSGFRGTEQFDFCPGGQFLYGEQQQARFDVPQAMGYSNTAANSAGYWHASNNVMTLQFHDGRVERYTISRMGSETVYLNGSKYFRSGQNRCR